MILKEGSMYNRILVPLDGSTLSEGVLPYVRALARSMNVAVELLHVNETTHRTGHSQPIHGDEYLENLAASFYGVTDVKHTVEAGNPAGMIVDVAAANPGTLIAMATHGYSGAKRWFLGSVAEKVLHATTNHLLLVRPAEGESGEEAELNTVLVPLDGSELAEKVLPAVRDLAGRLRLRVVLVRVLTPLYFGPPEAYVPMFGVNIQSQKELLAQARTAATRYLNGKVDRLSGEGIADVSYVLIDGGVEGAAAGIIDLAKKSAHGLVAMSTHGRSGIGRWILGSVAERVVRHSSEPVLVIRP
jgi:nucleotide-binding universal stress UspA family protein